MPNPRPTPRRLSVVACTAVLVLGACGSDDSATVEAGAPLPIGAGPAGESTVALDSAGEDAPLPGRGPIEFVAGDGLPSQGDDRPAFVLVGDDDELATVADRLGATVAGSGDSTAQDGALRDPESGDDPVSDSGHVDTSADDDSEEIAIGSGGIVGSALDADDPVVMSSGGADWSYYNHGSERGLATAVCDSDGVCTDNSDEAPTSTTADEATEIARDLLEDIGPGLDGANIATEAAWGTWNVTVAYPVDGHDVAGLGASVSVGDDGGVVAAAGLTGALEALGDYPTLDTAGAIDRMNDGWYTVGDGAGTFGPAPMLSEPRTVEVDAGEIDLDVGGGAEAQSEPAVPPAQDRPDDAPAPDADRDVPAPADIEPMPMPEPVDPPEPVTVTLTDVEWGLSVFHAWDGSGLYVVPTYVFVGDDDQYSVPAVTDDVLAPPETDEAPPENLPAPPDSMPRSGTDSMPRSGTDSAPSSGEGGDADSSDGREPEPHTEPSGSGSGEPGDGP